MSFCVILASFLARNVLYFRLESCDYVVSLSFPDVSENVTETIVNYNEPLNDATFISFIVDLEQPLKGENNKHYGSTVPSGAT